MLEAMGVHLDIEYDRSAWTGRLGTCIAAVTSVTQWLLVLFTDAYVPYWVRKRSLTKEKHERIKQSARASLAMRQVRPRHRHQSPPTRSGRPNRPPKPAAQTGRPNRPPKPAAQTGRTAYSRANALRRRHPGGARGSRVRLLDTWLLLTRGSC
jgi:hypothetical protein